MRRPTRWSDSRHDGLIVFDMLSHFVDGALIRGYEISVPRDALKDGARVASDSLEPARARAARQRAALASTHLSAREGTA